MLVRGCEDCECSPLSDGQFFGLHVDVDSGGMVRGRNYISWFLQRAAIIGALSGTHYCYWAQSWVLSMAGGSCM